MDGSYGPQPPRAPESAPPGFVPPQGAQPGFAPPQGAFGAPPPPAAYYYGQQANPYMYGYNPAGQPRRPYTAIRGLAIGITWALSVQFLFLVLGFAAFAQRVSLIDKVHDDPFSVTQHTIDSSDSFVRTCGVFNILAFLAVATMFVIWLWQARTNAAIYSPDVMGLPVGWTIGGWFIPLANFVLPFLVARDTHVGTTRGLRDRKQSGGVVTWIWWLFWCASMVLFVTQGAQANKGDRNNDSSVYIDDLQNSAKTELILCPVLLVAGVLLLVWIWKLTRLQRQRNAELAGQYGYGFGAPGAMAGYGYPGGPAPFPGGPQPFPGSAQPYPGSPQPMGYGQQPMPAPPMAAMPPMPPPMAPMPVPPTMQASPPTLVEPVPQAWPPAHDNPPTMVDRIPEMHTVAVPPSPAVQDAVPTQAVSAAQVESAMQDSLATQTVPVQDAVPTENTQSSPENTEPSPENSDSTEAPEPPGFTAPL